MYCFQRFDGEQGHCNASGRDTVMDKGRLDTAGQMDTGAAALSTDVSMPDPPTNDDYGDNPDAMQPGHSEAAGDGDQVMLLVEPSQRARDVGRVPLPTPTAATFARSSGWSRRAACLTRVGGVPQTDTDNPVVQSCNVRPNHGDSHGQLITICAQSGNSSKDLKVRDSGRQS